MKSPKPEYALERDSFFDEIVIRLGAMTKNMPAGSTGRLSITLNAGALKFVTVEHTLIDGLGRETSGRLMLDVMDESLSPGLETTQ